MSKNKGDFLKNVSVDAVFKKLMLLISFPSEGQKYLLQIILTLDSSRMLIIRLETDLFPNLNVVYSPIF